MPSDVLAPATPEQMWPQLVDGLVKQGLLKTEAIRSAFERCGRHLFVDQADDRLRRQAAGLDKALPIGHDQTISQPTMVAITTEFLQPQHGEKVLDVGLGSGWQSAIIRECVGSGGKVTAIERVEALVEAAKERLSGMGFDDIDIVYGNGMNPEDVPEGPFDIITSAAGCKDAPAFWRERLSDGGRMLFPKQVGQIQNEILFMNDGTESDAAGHEDGPLHRLCRIVRLGSEFREDFHGQLCRYVPLVEEKV